MPRSGRYALCRYCAEWGNQETASQQSPARGCVPILTDQIGLASRGAWEIPNLQRLSPPMSRSAVNDPPFPHPHIYIYSSWLYVPLLYSLNHAEQEICDTPCVRVIGLKMPLKGAYNPAKPGTRSGWIRAPCAVRCKEVKVPQDIKTYAAVRRVFMW